MNENGYESPFSARYASEDMQFLFSPKHKAVCWRRLWIILAECERELGLPVTKEQIDELKAHIEDVDFDAAAAYEKKFRHDVMAHIHAYGDLCPLARPIIHLGATSCYVGDNTDIWILRDAMTLVRARLLDCMRALRAFALAQADLPTLAFTHYQPAQPTTVGKRAALWLNDLRLDLEEIDFFLDTLRPLGCKGTTGTQASFVELFDGDEEKIKRLDQMVSEKMGFEAAVPVSGQTYSRKTDWRALSALSGLGQSANKIAMDIRLLANMKEIEEPFEKSQIGSSAMAYKRNPMRSERICALSRYLISNAQNAAMTAASQGFERTLDDSANRRLSLAEGFLCADGLLALLYNVLDGLVVYPKVIHNRLMQEMPFMATENILMDAVARGGDRQALHERIRVHSMAAAAVVKNEGKPSDLIDRIAGDDAFGLTREDIVKTLDPQKFTGRSAAQTREFVRDVIDPLLTSHKDTAKVKEINV